MPEVSGVPKRMLQLRGAVARVGGARIEPPARASFPAMGAITRDRSACAHGTCTDSHRDQDRAGTGARAVTGS